MSLPSPVQRTKKKKLSRGIVITLIVAGVLFIVSGVVFAVSEGTRRITAHAQNLHIVDDALLVANTTQAQAAFAVHLGQVETQFRADTSESRAENVEGARQGLVLLADGMALLAERDRVSPELEADTVAFAGSTGRILDLVEAGSFTEAQDVAAAEANPAYSSMVGHLSGELDVQRSAVFAADSRVAWWGDIARLLVALLIPLAVIVIYREVVRRQQRQAELEVRIDAEREVSKARDDFVANASHEFRTPLTSIYGLSQLLEEHEGVDEEGRELAGMISNEASDLSRMVEDLLTTARLEADALTFQREQVLTHEDIDDIIRPFNRSGTPIELSVKPAVVRVDRLRQRQVLRNLISNARKYGGDILRVTGEKNGDWFEWTVADNGDGIPEELQGKLFERFMHQGTNVSVPGGVGLGLSIVRALAEGMGGSVRYQRSDGWTRFIMQVPLAVADAVEERALVAAPTAGGSFQVAASKPFDGNGRS
ncbi:MAG: HAMP domain-containing histidine kinase [Acidimicrobiia bacterium]|nr:HAMP domain-containing histidine kinase [Acidimicrobiia bacterium]